MNKKEIKKHVSAAEKLENIKNKTFVFIKENIGKIAEYDAQQFIISEFKKNKLIMDNIADKPIVAVGSNTSFMHYFPENKKSRIIRKNNLIMIDIWAGFKKKNSPFADITWIAYSGKKVPVGVNKIFKKVIRARDEAVKFIRKSLKNKKIPTGKDIDNICRKSFGKLKRNFIHNTGHSLGFHACHGGQFNLSQKNDKPIKINIPFTIEPALYFNRKFGIRSEIDCYINSDYKLIITTKVQKKIILI
jgi:Xaa-Pro aminopeptidase